MPSATILGYGRMGREHEKAYREMGVTVDHYGDEKTWKSKIGKTDYLSICSPDLAHAEQVIAGLKAGQAVFCEKPLCLDKDQLYAISNIEGRLGINYPLRHHPSHHWEAGRESSEMVYHWGRAHKMKESWRKSMARYSPILAGGCHLVDYYLYHTKALLIPFAGYQPKPLIQICDFYSTAGYSGRLVCDMDSSDGDHYHRYRGSTNRIPTDKTSCLKHFIEGEDTRDICIEGMRICLEMDRLAQESTSASLR